MFTVQQRDGVRDRILALAREDRRIVAGAAVGSLALGGGDRFSDIDLTFAVGGDASVMTVLDDWTAGVLADSLRAVAQLGVGHFGESYVQEGLAKMESLRDLPGSWVCSRLGQAGEKVIFPQTGGEYGQFCRRQGF